MAFCPLDTGGPWPWLQHVDWVCQVGVGTWAGTRMGTQVQGRLVCVSARLRTWRASEGPAEVSVLQQQWVWGAVLLASGPWG